MHRHLAIVLTAAAALPVSGAEQILICDDEGSKVVRFDYDTGIPIDHFVGRSLTTLDDAQGMVRGPDGLVYISSVDNDRVIVVDGDGVFQREIRGNGELDGPTGLAFDEFGLLYAASFHTDRIVRYEKGAWGRFDQDSPDLDGPLGIAFGPDGTLYVASSRTDSVQAYAPDGTHLGAVIEDTPSLDSPQDVAFDAVGNMYVSSCATNGVLRMAPDGSRHEFFTPGLGGLLCPVGLAFTEDGTLLVVSNNGNASLLEYSGQGDFMRVVVPAGAGGLGTSPLDVILLPSPCPTDLDGDRTTGFNDLIEILDSWGVCR